MAPDSPAPSAPSQASAPHPLGVQASRRFSFQHWGSAMGRSRRVSSTQPLPGIGTLASQTGQFVSLVGRSIAGRLQAGHRGPVAGWNVSRLPVRPPDHYLPEAGERAHFSVSVSNEERRAQALQMIRERMSGLRGPTTRIQRPAPRGLPRVTSRASQSRVGRATGPAGAPSRMASTPAYVSHPAEVSGTGRLLGSRDRVTVERAGASGRPPPGPAPAPGLAFITSAARLGPAVVSRLAPKTDAFVRPAHTAVGGRPLRSGTKLLRRAGVRAATVGLAPPAIGRATPRPPGAGRRQPGACLPALATTAHGPGPGPQATRPAVALPQATRPAVALPASAGGAEPATVMGPHPFAPGRPHPPAGPTAVRAAIGSPRRRPALRGATPSAPLAAQRTAVRSAVRPPSGLRPATGNTSATAGAALPYAPRPGRAVSGRHAGPLSRLVPGQATSALFGTATSTGPALFGSLTATGPGTASRALRRGQRFPGPTPGRTAASGAEAFEHRPGPRPGPVGAATRPALAAAAVRRAHGARGDRRLGAELADSVAWPPVRTDRRSPATSPAPSRLPGLHAIAASVGVRAATGPRPVARTAHLLPAGATRSFAPRAEPEAPDERLRPSPPGRAPRPGPASARSGPLAAVTLPVRPPVPAGTRPAERPTTPRSGPPAPTPRPPGVARWTLALRRALQPTSSGRPANEQRLVASRPSAAAICAAAYRPEASPRPVLRVLRRAVSSATNAERPHPLPAARTARRMAGPVSAAERPPAPAMARPLAPATAARRPTSPTARGERLLPAAHAPGRTSGFTAAGSPGRAYVPAVLAGPKPPAALGHRAMGVPGQKPGAPNSPMRRRPTPATAVRHRAIRAGVAAPQARPWASAGAPITTTGSRPRPHAGVATPMGSRAGADTTVLARARVPVPAQVEPAVPAVTRTAMLARLRSTAGRQRPAVPVGGRVGRTGGSPFAPVGPPASSGRFAPAGLFAPAGPIASRAPGAPAASAMTAALPEARPRPWSAARLRLAIVPGAVPGPAEATGSPPGGVVPPPAALPSPPSGRYGPVALGRARRAGTAWDWAANAARAHEPGPPRPPGPSRPPAPAVRPGQRGDARGPSTGPPALPAFRSRSLPTQLDGASRTTGGRARARPDEVVPEIVGAQTVAARLPVAPRAVHIAATRSRSANATAPWAGRRDGPTESRATQSRATQSPPGQEALNRSQGRTPGADAIQQGHNDLFSGSQGGRGTVPYSTGRNMVSRWTPGSRPGGGRPAGISIGNGREGDAPPAAGHDGPSPAEPRAPRSVRLSEELDQLVERLASRAVNDLEWRGSFLRPAVF